MRLRLSALAGFVLLGTAVRLIHVSRPFIDGVGAGWSWRQADVAMIAENFYLEGFDIFHPRVSWTGPCPGYVGTEFPLVPFIAALLYVPLGVHDWIGRSVSVAFFGGSIPAFHALVEKASGQRVAVLASAIYVLAPLGIVAGRSFMPDTASVSLSIAALYLFVAWLDGHANVRLFVAAAALTALAILVKLPAVLIGLPMLYVAWVRHGGGVLRRPELWAFAGLSLAPPLAWYMHAYRLSASHVPYHFFGSSGLGLKSVGWYFDILGSNATSHLTPLAVAAMFGGIVRPASTRLRFVFHWWLVAIIVFAIVAGHGNRHPWYQLPLVPVAAALAAMGLQRFIRRLHTLTGSAIVVTVAYTVFFVGYAGLAYVYARDHYAPWGAPLWTAGLELKTLTRPGSLVIVADEGIPTTLYYSGRRGWHFLQHEGMFSGNPADSEQAISELETLRRHGATHLTFTRFTSWWLDQYAALRRHLDHEYRRVRETPDYVIFDLAALRSALPRTSSQSPPCSKRR